MKHNLVERKINLITMHFALIRDTENKFGQGAEEVIQSVDKFNQGVKKFCHY